jgi:signal transduction histidine kinase
MDLLMNLLEWSRSQSGRLVIKPVEVDLSQLITGIINLLNNSAIQKSITIIKKIPVSANVIADKEMIATVIRNLISNAIKFTKQGGIITVSIEQKEDGLIVAVEDNGIGIRKENIDKLFRIDESTSTVGTQNEKGTGLGLMLCKEFIAKHGGKIWVESELGKGSIFAFSIPTVLKQ